MNTEQIVKALECCKSFRDFYACDNCPYGNAVLADDESCTNRMSQDALALIKELQAHNENLQKENKYLRESLADEREHKEDMSVEFTCVFGQPHKVSDCPITEEIDKAKADTVKKMQDKLKATFCPDADYFGCDIHSAINEKAKEILNESQ